ncbi:MAG: NUDIX domain-containing protein [Micrococcales bacterium]
MPKDEGYLVTNTESRKVFQGKIWDVVSESFDFGDQRLTREFVAHPGAVAVVATDDLGRILLIRQYRHPVRAKLWEIPAGLTDVEGEAPASAANRELAEETGYHAGRLEPLLDFYTTPGGNSELIRVFHATQLTAVPREMQDGEEREIEIEWFEFDDVVADILAGRLKSPSLVVGAMALALTRR